MQKFYLHALDRAGRGFDDVYDLDSPAAITIFPILVQVGNYILADRPKMTGRSMQLQKHTSDESAPCPPKQLLRSECCVSTIHVYRKLTTMSIHTYLEKSGPRHGPRMLTSEYTGSLPERGWPTKCVLPSEWSGLPRL